MTIGVLISTLNDGIIKVPKVLIEPRPDIKYVVVHQFTNQSYKIIPEGLKRNDVTIYYLKGKGLSKSRNKAIENTTADVAIISDDDVRYSNEYFDNIKIVYENNIDLDVACFRIKSLDSDIEYKNYTEERFNLKEGFPHFISSVEITFRPDRIKNKLIAFDTRFGLGSFLLPAGEEKVFIHDCISNGLAVWYYPFYVVNHSLVSSGKKREKYSKKLAHIYGAQFYRIDGLNGLKGLLAEYKICRRCNTSTLKSFTYLFHLTVGFIYIFLRRF